MRYVLVLLGVVVGLYLLHRLATHADRRGWVYYRSKPPHGTGSTAAMRVMSLFDPTIEHVIEEEEAASDRLVIDETGEPPREEEKMVEPVDYQYSSKCTFPGLLRRSGTNPSP